METDRERAIKQRIAEKDAYFIVLNGSNVAGELLAAKMSIDESFRVADRGHVLSEWKRIRDAVIADNIAKVEEVKGINEDQPPE